MKNMQGESQSPAELAESERKPVACRVVLAIARLI